MSYLQRNLNLSDYKCDYKPEEKKPCQKRIILECGCSPQDAIFEIDDGAVNENQSFVLDRLMIDTTGLCKPQVKIEFSSLIFFEAESEGTTEPEVEVDLLFRLERVCNGTIEEVQNWRYLKEIDVEGSGVNELELEISEPFTVIFCDRACPGCCEYRMIVEGIDFEGEFDALRVVKANLSAIAHGLCDNC